MKYLKKFENFDLGRFSETEDPKDENEFGDIEEIEDEVEFDMYDFDEDEDEDEDEKEMLRGKIWGDEIVEGLSAKQKKLPKALQDAILKRSGKSTDKDDKKDTKGKKGDKEDEKDAKSKNGLSAAQKKLPKALQDAILKRQK